MKETGLSLLPSAGLQERIRKENYTFSERETLLILYRYARTQDERLTLLAEFSETASEMYAAIARRIRLWEEKKLARFRKSETGYLYEMCITGQNEEMGESCFFDTYEAALAGIDAHYEAYAHIGLKRGDPDVFEIRKHRVLVRGDAWQTRLPASCRVDVDGRVLFVDDFSDWSDAFPETPCEGCDSFYLYDDVQYPFFVEAGQLVRYMSDHYPHAKVAYGICTEDFDRGESSRVYVFPLNSEAVRRCDVSEDACMVAHEHIDAPLCEIVPPEEIPDELRASVAAFWDAYRARTD